MAEEPSKGMKCPWLMLLHSQCADNNHCSMNSLSAVTLCFTSQAGINFLIRCLQCVRLLCFMLKLFLQEKVPVDAEDCNDGRSNDFDDPRRRRTAPMAALLELGDLIQQKRQEQRSKKTHNMSQHDRRIKLEEWRYERPLAAETAEAALAF